MNLGRAAGLRGLVCLDCFAFARLLGLQYLGLLALGLLVLPGRLSSHIRVYPPAHFDSDSSFESGACTFEPGFYVEPGATNLNRTSITNPH